MIHKRGLKVKPDECFFARRGELMKMQFGDVVLIEQGAGGPIPEFPDGWENPAR
jgi:hypothetical protein